MFEIIPLPKELIRIILEYAIPEEEFYIIKWARLLKIIEYQVDLYSVCVPKHSSRINTLKKYLRSARHFIVEISMKLFKSPIMPFSHQLIIGLFEKTPCNLKPMTTRADAICLVESLGKIPNKLFYYLPEEIRRQQYYYGYCVDTTYMLQWLFSPKYYYLVDLYNDYTRRLKKEGDNARG